MEDAAGVPAEVGNLLHLRILPDAELVVHEAVRGEDLSVEGVPKQRAHLRLGLNRLEEASALRVPKFDGLVSRTAP